MISLLSRQTSLSIFFGILLLFPCTGVYPQTITFGGPDGALKHSSDFVPGQTYYGRNKYVAYTAGNLPIIISVPHGGTLNPSELPDRTSGLTTRDSYTVELAQEIFDAIYQRTKKYPHMVVCLLSRVKVDMNREVLEATNGDTLTTISYNEYHAFLDTAAAIVTQTHGKGLLIDIHGHGHPKQRLELGYLLLAAELDLSDDQLNTPSMVAKSSIRGLIQSGTNPFVELLRGETSLGAFFEYRGYPAVPSNLQPAPSVGDLYFTGGYITQVHGSRIGGAIDAIQIEFNSSGVRDTPENRKAFGRSAAEILDQYMELHYFNAAVAEAKLALNEVLFDIPLDDDGTTAIEGDANGDGVRSVRADEFVEIANVGTQDVDVSGFQILERSYKPVFTFPSTTILKPNELAVIFGGVGPNGFGPQFPTSMKVFAASYGNADSGFYYSSSKTNLLNTNDNVILFDPASNRVFDELAWGSTTLKTTVGKKLIPPNTLNGDSIAGAIKQSVARSPGFAGLWTMHSSINGEVYSPGSVGTPATDIAFSGDGPYQFRLLQNYPNPFNPSTTITFELASSAWVELKVYDVLGREVTSLVSRQLAAGTHEVKWHAAGAPSGVYFYQLVAHETSSSSSETSVLRRKMILLR